MQKVLLLTSIGLLFLYMSVSAQKVNTDSFSLVSKISADQLKLGKLQNQLEQIGFIRNRIYEYACIMYKIQ